MAPSGTLAGGAHRIDFVTFGRGGGARVEKSLHYPGGELVLTADRLTLTRGKRTAFSTPLQEIREATVEQAKAFAHPRLGLAFGLALVVPAVWLLVTALRGAPGALLLTR